MKKRPKRCCRWDLIGEGSTSFCLISNSPGPWAPPFLILPSLNMTALSYSWTTFVQIPHQSILSLSFGHFFFWWGGVVVKHLHLLTDRGHANNILVTPQSRSCYLDAHEEGDWEGDDDQEDGDNCQKNWKTCLKNCSGIDCDKKTNQSRSHLPLHPLHSMTFLVLGCHHHPFLPPAGPALEMKILLNTCAAGQISEAN